MADTTITVGEFQLTALSDAATAPAPASALFPSVSAADWDAARASYPWAFAGDNWNANFGCYLIRGGGRTILMDTGIGDEGAPYSAALGIPGRLMQELNAAGVSADDVDTVFMTHCHPDHVGWNTVRQGDQFRPTFPSARYLLHRRDFEDFQQLERDGKLDPPYVEVAVAPLERAGVLDLIDGERELAPGIQLLHTPGHTMGHMSLLLQSGSAGVLLWGDVAHHPVQIAQPEESPIFDMDGGLAATTRGQVIDRIEAEGLTAAAGHFAAPGFGRVVRLEGKRYFQAL